MIHFILFKPDAENPSVVTFNMVNILLKELSEQHFFLLLIEEKDSENEERFNILDTLLQKTQRTNYFLLYLKELEESEVLENFEYALSQENVLFFIVTKKTKEEIFSTFLKEYAPVHVIETKK